MFQVTVADMSCQHCVKTITAAVQQLDADAQVDANVETKVVSIRSQLDDARLRAAIEEAGYTVTAKPA